MYGIEAINEANGWNMAALGILVVFTSLTILSVIISQLHKILILWDNKNTMLHGGTAGKKLQTPVSEEKTGAAGGYKTIGCDNREWPGDPDHQQPDTWPENTGGLADMWSPLIEKLDDPFTLADLYKLADENQFPHPHLTITRLRRENILTPVQNQRFTFNYKRH